MFESKYLVFFLGAAVGVVGSFIITGIAESPEIIQYATWLKYVFCGFTLLFFIAYHLEDTDTK